MKALVYMGTQEIAYRDEPDPTPGNDEALVRIDAVGICGSDMHAYHGKDPRRVPPMILGHEASGQVLTGTSKGRRVAINPLVSCGLCKHCLSGRSNLCADRDLVGLGRPGAFAELLAVPEANLLPIPDDMDPTAAALTEPTATALHTLALSERTLARPLSEARALVIGGGSIGLLSALLLKSKGCGEILLGDTNALRRDSAAATGCCSVYDPAAGPGPQAGAYDLVVDAVGSGLSRKAASAAVMPGGVLAHIGLQDEESGLDIRKLTLSEVTFIGTYTYTALDLMASIDALYSGALGDLSWVEQRPIGQGAAAFDDLHCGRTAAAKIVLLPE